MFIVLVCVYYIFMYTCTYMCNRYSLPLAVKHGSHKMHTKWDMAVSQFAGMCMSVCARMQMNGLRLPRTASFVSCFHCDFIRCSRGWSVSFLTVFWVCYSIPSLLFYYRLNPEHVFHYTNIL